MGLDLIYVWSFKLQIWQTRSCSDQNSGESSKAEFRILLENYNTNLELILPRKLQNQRQIFSTNYPVQTMKLVLFQTKNHFTRSIDNVTMIEVQFFDENKKNLFCSRRFRLRKRTKITKFCIKYLIMILKLCFFSFRRSSQQNIHQKCHQFCIPVRFG